MAIPSLRGVRLASFLAVALLGVVVPAAGQTPRLTEARPAELGVQPAGSELVFALSGEEIEVNDGRTYDDRVWTARNFRYYARRTDGDGVWLRLYLGDQRGWAESAESQNALRRNGTAYSDRVRLPAALYGQRPGTIELRVDRIDWVRVWKQDPDDSEEGWWELEARVAAQSNVLRVPVRPAPTDAPVVERVTPERTAVAGDGTIQMNVQVTNLMAPAEARIGTTVCPILATHAVEGYLFCEVPAHLLRQPGMHLVGVTTPNGGARRMARFWVDAPPELVAVEPGILAPSREPSGPPITIRFRGGLIHALAFRAPGGAWEEAGLHDVEDGRATLRLPPPYYQRPGVVEIRIANVAGETTGRLLVCGGEGSPDGCPLTAQRPALGAGVAAQPAQRPAAPPPRIQVNPATLRLPGPAPEPPGLRAVRVTPNTPVVLDDGRRIEVRRVEGADRLHLVTRDGTVQHVFPAGAAVVRDDAGNASVRVREGVMSVGRIGR